MPWDGTELRVAPIEDGVPGRGRLVKGGMQESVLAPLWRDAASLYVVTDWPGWWNLYQVGLVGQPSQALYPAEEEFAGPLWQLGGRPYAMLGDGRLAVLHGRSEMRLGLLDPETGELGDLDIGYPVFTSGLSADGMSILGVAGGPTDPAVRRPGRCRRRHGGGARPGTGRRLTPVTCRRPGRRCWKGSSGARSMPWCTRPPTRT